MTEAHIYPVITGTTWSLEPLAIALKGEGINARTYQLSGIYDDELPQTLSGIKWSLITKLTDTNPILIGSCFGAIVAIEIAQYLKRKYVSARPLLVLLDPIDLPYTAPLDELDNPPGIAAVVNANRQTCKIYKPWRWTEKTLVFMSSDRKLSLYWKQALKNRREHSLGGLHKTWFSDRADLELMIREIVACGRLP